MLDGLTDRELALVAAARAGSVLACGEHGVDVLASSEDPGPRVRAGLIRELLLGRRGELDPRGVRIRGARIVGTLDLDYVTAVTGLDLVDCVIDDRVDLTRAVLPRLVLSGSRIAGIQADGVRVGGDLILRRARISGAGATGAVCLGNAQVDGVLDLTETEIGNDSGPALDAADLEVARSMFLDRARVSGTGAQGAIDLCGAHIGGRLTIDDAELGNHAGPALHADGLSVGGDLLLHRTRLSGTGDNGAICLASARLGDDLYLVEVEARNDSGPALYADGLHIEDTIVLLHARMAGTGDGGAIWLLGARLGGLRVVDSELTNDSGPALFAEQLQVRGLVHVERVRMSGTGEAATVRLATARIGGRFTLADATVTNPSGPLVDLHETTVAGGVHFPAEIICDQAPCGHGTIDLNDFTYTSLAPVDARQWLHLIRRHTKEYRPSPYQRLAAVERAAGHDGNARRILITQQQDLRHRAPAALGGRLTRRVHWLWGALAGYGYRARRTALALLAALAAAGLISLWAGHTSTGPGRHAAEHTTTSATAHTPCSTVELIGLGLDRGLPLGPTGLRTRCDLDTESPAGQTFTVFLWIIQAAVWGLATLTIAGYTGLIRKST